MAVRQINSKHQADVMRNLTQNFKILRFDFVSDSWQKLYEKDIKDVDWDIEPFYKIAVPQNLTLLLMKF